METSIDRPYTVSRNGDEIVVRLHADLFSRDEMTYLLDRLLLENLRRRASLNEEEIAELADEVDGAVWNRLRPMVEEKLRGSAASLSS
jgi:hypothetical protein